MDIIEAIRQRRSVRTFNGNGLDDNQHSLLLKVFDEARSPFDAPVSLQLAKFNLREGYKPSTYGMIRGAEDYFLLAFGDDGLSALAAGFRFEQVVLKAWMMGLGTCWIAGTFKGSSFERGISWPDGGRLRVVCPVGYAAKPAFMEKVARMTARSNHRKPFGDLFFKNGFADALDAGNTFAESLEMMRLAPSSTNSQPWRALVDGTNVHFFYEPVSKFSLLDCGIGLCHFSETEKFRAHSGSFYKAENAPAAPHNWCYLISYARTDLR